MDEIDIRIARLDLVSRFPRNSVGRALARQALEAWDLADGEDAKYEVERLASDVAGHADLVFRQNAYYRDGDMSAWFCLPEAGLQEIARRQRELRQAWLAANDDEEALAAAEAEAERIDRLEDEGAYGRTLPLVPETDRWIYVRFGGMPAAGKSAFGLAREDNEDGPDPWRAELGNMTHEAGVSVFRAYRHPDRADAYVLMEPAFCLARYGVCDQESHLLAVVPDPDNGGEIAVLRLDGSLSWSKAFDGTRRAELGSDGEYLVDTGKPFTVHSLSLEDVWVSEQEPMPDFLARRRGSTYGA